MSHNDVLDIVFRWAHLIAGIMWIGNSMLFNWLDRNLVKPPADAAHRLSQGTIYMVHSGAFYEVEKKLLEPGQLPDQLHWFKWQNGITWLTGISLLVIVYYMHDGAFLIDPVRRPELSPEAAIWISATALVAGWILYDTIWMLLGERAERLAQVLTAVLLIGAAYTFTELFSGRAAYIETGVLMGTMMTGNVWFRILPSQKELIAATKSGREQDPKLSIRAKQRSIHNNYFTFPLLFIMVSNHFHAAYGSKLRFFVLFAAMIGGAGVRHFMNVRYSGQRWLVPALAMGAIGIGGMMALSSVKDHRPEYKFRVDFADAQAIIVQRCMPCHSSHPTDDVFKQAPNDVKFDLPEQIVRMAPRIKERAVELPPSMPFMNKTKMTDEERAKLGAWIDQGAKLE